MEFSKKHRREPMELQLTAMIDIFTMIVIFLVMGTVIGVADVSVPLNTKLPKSSSVEALDAAPQVVFNVQTDSTGSKKTFIEVKALSSDLSTMPQLEIGDFRVKAEVGNPKVDELKRLLSKAIEKLSPEQRKGGVLLNIVADQATPYRDLFDVIKVFRESGFQSLLFVAAGDPKLGKILDDHPIKGSGP